MNLVYSPSYDQHQFIIEFEIGSYPTYDHHKYVDINFQIDEVTRSNIQSCHAEVAPIHWPTSGHFMMKQGVMRVFQGLMGSCLHKFNDIVYGYML